MNSWLRDFKHAARGLARTPAFTLIVIATLALPIGGNTAIFSVADVFRTSSVASIRKAWETMYLKLGSGARLAIPRGAPGDARFLMRGRMLSSNGTKLEVLLYQWQRGKTLQSVWLIARPGVPRVSRLIALARLQAA